MNHYEETRGVFKYQFRLNNTTVHKKGKPDDFRRMENLLWNCFGPPRWVMKRCTRDMFNIYMKKNHEGVWQRFRNEFFFLEANHKKLALTFKPDEYVVVKELI